MSKKNIQITVAKYSPHEMAFILVNKKSVFTGNFWDFHSGCMGTKIAGYDLTGLWDQGIESLAGVLKLLMEKDGKMVSLEKKELTEKEYNRLC